MVCLRKAKGEFKAKGGMYMFKGKFQIEDGPIYADTPDCTMCYDKSNDAFIYKANGDDECVYKANEKGLYPIGNGDWRWDDLMEM